MFWPKCLGTETIKTGKSRDRNGQTETVQTETARPNRPDGNAHTESARSKSCLPESAGKRAGMSELQAHHCVTPEQ